MINPRVLLCTDLDRTLLPNGQQPEPIRARSDFRDLVSQPAIGLVYVSGRDQSRVMQAMREYGLPTPDFVIADVGTSIYQIEGGRWNLIELWTDAIKADWRGRHANQLQAELGKLPDLTLQAADQQGDYKLSFERHPTAGLQVAVDVLEQKLAGLNYRCRCVVSIDETTDTGLVDVLPSSANKRAALEFLGEYLSIKQEQMVFSGDSGNDLDVLLSPMRATLVGNATQAVRAVLVDQLKREPDNPLYFAVGYYAAGIVEGFFHHFPEYAPDKQELAQC